MAAVCHIGSLKKAFHMTGTPFIHLHAKFEEDILISSRDMPPKLNPKQRPLLAEFYFRCLFPHVSTYGSFICVMIKKLAK